jgi:hypothetical protein
MIQVRAERPVPAATLPLPTLERVSDVFATIVYALSEGRRVTLPGAEEIGIHDVPGDLARFIESAYDPADCWMYRFQVDGRTYYGMYTEHIPGAYGWQATIANDQGTILFGRGGPF